MLYNKHSNNLDGKLVCNILSLIRIPEVVRTMQKSPRSKFQMVLIQALLITESEGNLTAEKTLFLQVRTCQVGQWDESIVSH